MFQLLDRSTFYPPKGTREHHWYTDGSAWRIRISRNEYKEYAGSGIALYHGPEGDLHSPADETIHLPVVTKPGAIYHGAQRKTNNTGELTAILVAIDQATARRKGEFHQIHSDSQYAIGRALTTGPSRKNKELVRQLRTALHRCRDKHGYRNVTLTHVKAHSDHPRNDMADELAKAGATADCMHHTTHTQNEHCHRALEHRNRRGINSTPLGTPRIEACASGVAAEHGTA